MLYLCLLSPGGQFSISARGVLQAEIEQKDRAASMVSGLDRLFGSGFRKWDNLCT